MADKIKLFLYTKECYTKVGIDLPEQNPNRLISSKKVFIITFSTMIFMSMVISCITATKSLYDIAVSFYLSTTSLVTMTLYVLNIVHIGNIFKLTEKFERFIERSKLIRKFDFFFK